MEDDFRPDHSFELLAGGGVAHDEDGTLRRIGQVLLFIQGLERSIRFVMTFVLQKEGVLTVEKLEAQEANEREKTIGYFLTQLRYRADLDPSIDDRLRLFLNQRNTLVHHLMDIPGWSLETPEGLQVANEFITEVQTSAIWLRFFFAGLMKAWAEQDGIGMIFDDEPELDFLTAWRDLATSSVAPKSRNSPGRSSDPSRKRM